MLWSFFPVKDQVNFISINGAATKGNITLLYYVQLMRWILFLTEKSLLPYCLL